MTDKVAKYIEGVGWRYDTEHSMTRRMAEHDYQSRCIYMLTLTLADRTKDSLGTLSWTGEGKTPENARLNATTLGSAVANEWYRLEREHPQIQIIRLQLMPEHLHVVVYVKTRLEKHLGKYVGIVKNRCNKHFWQELTSRGLLGPKGVETPPSLFGENFTDSILMHSGQLENMIRYVEQNPYRALVKKECPELFRKVEELVVYASDAAKLQRTGPGSDAGKQVSDAAKLQRTEPEPGSMSGTKVLGTFAAIGNRWLLDRPLRMQVRCHNNTTPENLRLISRQKEYFLDRGRKGGVVVSPCISAGEREIARAALDAGIPLVVILENGFPPMYKPPGKYFEACANGLLLMLAPWPYHMEKRTISRQQCLALNEMAFKLSTEPWTQELERMLM